MRPPLETCYKYAKQRNIPDIEYKIDRKKIKEYWEELYEIDNEPIFDTSKMTPDEVAREILSSL